MSALSFGVRPMVFGASARAGALPSFERARLVTRAAYPEPLVTATAVRFGRLGGHPPRSGRFEAPDLARIPETPLVSCLCVTENRHAFMPWLLWCFDRQLWKRRELVIVDSSAPAVAMPQRPDVRVLHVAPGTPLGKKRNLALDAARGEVVAWFDDDDWQHPKRLSLLVPLLREYGDRLGASFIGPSKSYFLDIAGRRCERYYMPRYAIFNGSVYYTEMVRHARFPEDVLRTEDTRWISTLLRSRQGAALGEHHESLFLWLSHAVNVTNANHVRRLPLAASEVIAKLGSAWNNTPEQLAALRHRLASYPAKRALRVALAEPAPTPRSACPAEAASASPTGAQLREEPRAASGVRAAASQVRSGSASDRGPRPGLVLYLSGSARPKRAAYVGVVQRNWHDAVTAVAIHERRHWNDADYVGVFDGENGDPPQFEALATAVSRSAGRADVYVAGRSERTTLQKLLAPAADDELFLEQLASRLPSPDAFALDRTVQSLEWGWIARPSVFAEFVRDWLVPVRALIRSVPERVLRRGAGGQIVAPRILGVLPAVAFTQAGRAVLPLGLERPPASSATKENQLVE